MRNLLLATTLVVAGAGWMQSGPATAFDPAGKWTYTTQDEQGTAISGTMMISGKPGSYTGTITTAQGQDLPVADVFTSSKGMVVVANLPDGASAVIKVTRKPDGKFDAGWAAVRNVIPATMERAK